MFYWPTSMNLEVEWEKRLLKTHFLVNDVKIEWQVAWNKIEKSYNSGISFLGKPCWGSEPTWKFGMHVQARKPQFKLKSNLCDSNQNHFLSTCQGKKNLSLYHSSVKLYKLQGIAIKETSTKSNPAMALKKKLGTGGNGERSHCDSWRCSPSERITLDKSGVLM